jgi:hypothetical protein
MTGRIGLLSVNSLPTAHPSIEPGRRMSVRSQSTSSVLCRRIERACSSVPAENRLVTGPPGHPHETLVHNRILFNDEQASGWVFRGRHGPLSTRGSA